MKDYDTRLREAAKQLGGNTLELIGCILQKHDSAMIQVGLEMKERIELLEDLLERSLPLLRGHVHGSEMVKRICAALGEGT